MASEQVLKNLCSSLESTKATERKKSMNELSSMLHEQDTLHLLNRNCQTNLAENITWNKLFHLAHNLAVKEAEKIKLDEQKRESYSETTKNNWVTTKSGCGTFVTLVVNKANLGLPRLKCSDLISSVLNVMSNNYLMKSYSQHYLQILDRHVLQVHKYWADTTPKQWADLIERFWDLFALPPAELDLRTVATILNKIIICSAAQSHSVLLLRSRFPVLTDAFNVRDLPKNVDLHKELLQLAITVCQQVAKESRMATCRFGEDVFKAVIYMYEHKKSETKSLLFNFLLLQLRLHNPRGAREGDAAAYAYNWQTWSKHCQALYTLVETEIRKLQHVTSNPKNMRMSANFLQLAVAVCKQVFENERNVLEVTQLNILNETVDELMLESMPKRRKVEVGLEVIMDILQSSNKPLVILPWLAVLTELLSTYPTVVKLTNFSPLLQLIGELQNTCEEVTVMGYICRCCIALLKVEKMLDIHLIPDVTPLWGKVWETVLRTVGLNQCEEGSHQLLQAMLVHGKFTSPNPLLLTYLSNAIKLSPPSACTLDILCHLCDVPDTVSGNPQPVKLALLDWLLPRREEASLGNDKLATLCPRIVARTLVRLVVKCSPKRGVEREVNLAVDDLDLVTSIEESYVDTTFEGGLLVKDPNCAVEKKSEKYLQVSAAQVIQEALERLEELLRRDSTLLEDRALMPPGQSEKLSALLALITHLSLLVSVMSFMVSWGIIQRQDLPTHSLCVVMRNLLLKVWTCGELFLTDPEVNRAATLNLVTHLKALLPTDLQADVVLQVRNAVPAELVTALISLLPVKTVLHLNEDYDIDEEMDVEEETMRSESSLSFSGIDSQRVIISESSKLRQEVASVIQAYCYTSEESLTEQQNSCLMNTLEILSYSTDYRDECNFKIAETIVTGAVGLSTLDRTGIEGVLKVLQAMCRTRHKESHAAYRLLSLITGILPHVARLNLNSAKENLMALFIPFLFSTSRNKYGVKVYSQLIKSVAEFTKLDPTGLWARWQPKKEEGRTAVSEELIFHLKSPFHEIRMACAGYVGLLFHSSVTPVSVQWHKRSYEKVCAAVMESFVVEGDLSREEKIDEGANRTASAMHTMATMVVVCPAWRRKALFMIFQLVHEKNISFDLVCKVLRLVGEHLKLQECSQLVKVNASYLVHHWMEQEYQLQKFPWQLMGCVSITQFYRQYKDIIVPILLQREEEETLTHVSQKVGKNLRELVEGCFPHSMACLLPYIASSDSTDSSSITEAEANTSKCLHNQLERILGGDAINTLITMRIDEVIVNVIRLLYDPKHFSELCGCQLTLPEPIPPVLNHDMVMKVVEHLQEGCPDSSVALVTTLSQRVPHQLQRILLPLASDIHHAPTQEDKLQAFHRYATFADILADQLKMPVGLHTMNLFVVRDIIHTLIHLLRGGGLLLDPVGHFFSRFCTMILPSRSGELSKFLGVIVSSLVPLACQNAKVLNLLTTLVVKNEVHLYEAIKLVDPFPPDPEFLPLREVYCRIKYAAGPFSLDDEVKQFLGVASGHLGCRVEGLHHLRKQLSEKKWELRQMYSDMRTMRGFSEDCATSPLHRLICALVELTVTPDKQVSEEASRCLGELGPLDLGTMILKPEQGHVASKPLKNKEGSLVALARHVMQLMVEYLVDPQISVVQAASDALYSILSTEQGRAAADVKIPDGVQLERSIIVPFYHCGEARGKWGLVVSEDHMSQVVDQGYLWVPVEDCTHDTWITNLVCTLLEAYPEDSFLRQLAPVCRVKVSFSEELLPLLVDLLLCTGKKICQIVVSKNMRYFFKQHYDGHKSRVLSKQIFFNKPSVQCMLNVVHYIRLQGVVRDNTSQSLDMDYLHVAQAAQFCSAHFTSILYVELWSSEQIKEHPSIIVGDNVSPLDCICDKDPERGRDVEDILREAYTRLQYKDAVSGCGSSYLLDSLTRVSHLELEGQWEQAMQEYQLQSKNDDLTAIQGLCRCLHRMGSHNLLHRYLAATEKTSELLDIQYECGWRLGQWDLGRCPQDDLYEGHHYDALQATEEGDLARARVSLSRARTCIATTALAHASLESAMNLYPSLSRLQTLQELEDFLNDNPLNQDSVKLLMTRWREQDRLGYGEFEYLELVLAQRLVLLRMASSMFQFNVKDELTYQLEIAALARKEGWPQVAGNCLARLATISFDKPPCIVLEEARLHWAKGNREVATALLKSLLRRLEQDTRGGEDQLVQRSIALHLYGSWMVETKSENPQNIIDQYFLKALAHLEDLAESREKQEICLEAHSSLARFADGQYQNLVQYTKSAVFETKQKGIVEAQVALEKIRKEPSTEEMKKMSSILSRQKSIDTIEVENTEKEKNNYLTLAVKYYCQSLQRGDKHNLQVFRLVSLWLDNMSHEALADILDTELGNIPSYKFLPLLPQLSARISNDANNPFVYKLNKLLERCSVEHPHHTLPVLLSIVNLYLDKKYTHKLDSRALDKKNKESRVLGAKMLLDRLQSVDTIAPILTQMDKLSQALISLAYYKFGKDKGTYTIPNTEPILRIKNYDCALLPSFTLPVSKSGQYNNIVGIHSFENKFEYLGGVNVPKKFTCTDTNGIKHALLVKGQDDLRQDAVMQQVFTILNMLLRENKETNKRKLLIRTYKIVPLSQRSGVLEWCQNTMPLEDYLVSIKGAHKRYFPEDYNNNHCRSLMNRACKLSNAERLKVYLDICKNFHPVFHHFFLENFRTPGVWFERRQAYMHSVATSSMIGYILGLGDRHVKNILLDKTTAEIIHIDFGIAFEQGKILPTPETVPFRLTRDIVDGMGVSGIEGVFRKSCEKTMSVLRQNQVTILTILEVLLYDPLYAWTITPAEGFKRQHKDQGPIRDTDREATKEVNKLAERALTRLKQKLDGTEDGTVTSVNGQVNKLLHQARDPVNLSRLYDGWQPFL